MLELFLNILSVFKVSNTSIRCSLLVALFGGCLFLPDETVFLPKHPTWCNFNFS